MARAIRILSLLVFAAGIGWGWHKFARTPEQKDLTRYVEVELPALFEAEKPIHASIERLGKAPGLKPEEARKLIVDDVIPRLLRLKKGAEGARTDTDETRALNAGYLKVTDQLIDACRKCVEVIDDPKVSTGDGLKQVRERFDAVRAAYRDWDREVQLACARNHLAPPAVH